MAEKHTPAPWEAVLASYDVEGPYEWWLFSPSYGAVGYKTGGKQRHQDSRWILTEADARLISAAPDMLEALRLHAAYEALPTDRGGKSGPKGQAHATWIAARDAAIAKAEGRA